MAKLVDCPSCSGLVRPSSRMCPHCDVVFRPIQAAAMRLAAAVTGFAMLTACSCYGRAVFNRLCREFPDGGGETPETSDCVACTPERDGPDCVNGVLDDLSPCWRFADGGVGPSINDLPDCLPCTPRDAGPDAGPDAGVIPGEPVCIDGAFEIPDAGAADAG